MKDAEKTFCLTGSLLQTDHNASSLQRPLQNPLKCKHVIDLTSDVLLPQQVRVHRTWKELVKMDANSHLLSASTLIYYVLSSHQLHELGTTGEEPEARKVK